MSDKPEPLNEGVRKSMKSNKGKGTSPELRVRKALRDAGYPGYRLNWKGAPGKPDICYPGRRVAIFVQGCFWHRCPRCNLPLPKHNSEFWETKFQRNVERDSAKRALLTAGGWTVVDLWECDLKKDFEGSMIPVVELLETRPSRRGKTTNSD